MKKLCLMLFISLLVSCANLPDFVTCKELTPSSAKCIKVISEEKFDWNDDNLVNGKSYWEIRPTLLQIPADSYAELKAYLLKNCRRYQNCHELSKKIDALDRIKE